MIILVSGVTKTFARFRGHPAFGHLKTPRNGNCVGAILASGHPWACDNDAFLAWDEVRFRSMCRAVAAADRSRLIWVAAPDVVGDAKATADRFEHWQPELAALGLPLALVGQDGAEDMELPWGRFACLFIGGSTPWKLSAAAEGLIAEARSRGKWVHMGRVNTYKRIRHAWESGCDSIDGTCFSKWPDKYFPKALEWVERLRKQPTLMGF